MGYFFGVSGRVDLLLVAQIIPNIIGSMISGGAGEILVTKSHVEEPSKQTFVSFFTFSSTFFQNNFLFDSLIYNLTLSSTVFHKITFCSTVLSTF
jgi:hypothetical protein